MTKLVKANSLALAPLQTGQGPAAVYLATLAKSGQPTMRCALRKVTSIITGTDGADLFTFPWHTLRYEHVEAIKARLGERYSTKTINRILSALRGVLKVAWHLKLMDSEDYYRAKDVKSVKGTVPPTGRVLDAADLRRLAAKCRAGGNIGSRNGALLALLYGCGLRRAEACSASLEAYDSKEQTVMVRGKGNKARLTRVPSTWHPFLKTWIKVRGDEPGFLLLLNPKKPNELRTHEVNRVLKDLATEAGIEPFTPHDLRRSFATHLIDDGVDLLTVRNLLGHTNLETTSIYDRRGEKAKIEAVEHLFGPDEET